MKPRLHVMAPGLHTTVQDLGRYGSQDLGVPVAGALDSISLRLANAVVGNPENTGALEIRFMGPTFRVDADSARVALTGTTADLEVLGERGRTVPAGRSVTLVRGQIFRIEAIRDTSCCYLGVEGGFDVWNHFGSQSTYVRGGFGGFQGRTLVEGDDLPLVLETAPEREETRLTTVPSIDGGDSIRVILGPQDDYFEPESIEAFLTSDFKISTESDRMGLRLEGPTLKHSKGYNLVSDGIATGALQVPGNGQAIFLVADHQTTGGYPKIATVISADLPRVGRRRPGGVLRFEAIEVAEAERLRREQETAIQEAIRTIARVTEADGGDSWRLLHVNLVSGVVSADS